jgi:hypothetical protein
VPRAPLAAAQWHHIIPRKRGTFSFARRHIEQLGRVKCSSVESRARAYPAAQRRYVPAMRGITMLRPTFANLYAWLSLGIFVGCATPPPRNSLSVLAATTNPCSVRLNPAWVGTACDTISTGYFATADEDAKSLKLRCRLKFDRFQFSENPSRGGFGARTISRSVGHDSVDNIHSHRASLPSDEELAKATTVSELTRLLGRPQGSTTGWGEENEMHSTAGWAFFTLNGDESMETISIFCMVTQRRGKDPYVDSMRITRGVTRPGEWRKGRGITQRTSYGSQYLRGRV